MQRFKKVISLHPEPKVVCRVVGRRTVRHEARPRTLAQYVIPSTQATRVIHEAQVPKSIQYGTGNATTPFLIEAASFRQKLVRFFCCSYEGSSALRPTCTKKCPRPHDASIRTSPLVQNLLWRSGTLASSPSSAGGSLLRSLPGLPSERASGQSSVKKRFLCHEGKSPEKRAVDEPPLDAA